ncbi:MAG: hypothetical protein ABSA85_18050, partial [Terracidiphilus sp.]
MRIATGDFNRDGRTDVAGSFTNSQTTGVEVLRGTAAPHGSVAVDDVPRAAGFQPANRRSCAGCVVLASIVQRHGGLAAERR